MYYVHAEQSVVVFIYAYLFYVVKVHIILETSDLSFCEHLKEVTLVGSLDVLVYHILVEGNYCYLCHLMVLNALKLLHL